MIWLLISPARVVNSVRFFVLRHERNGLSGYRTSQWRSELVTPSLGRWDLELFVVYCYVTSASRRWNQTLSFNGDQRCLATLIRYFPPSNDADTLSLTLACDAPNSYALMGLQVPTSSGDVESSSMIRRDNLL